MQFQKKEKRQTTVRFDSHHVRLRTGEVQRKTGSYMYRWTDKLGKRNTIYAATLEDLREQEEQILVDQHDGIKANIKNVTVNDVYELWCQLKRGIKDSTMKNYIYMYELFVKPTFGKKKLVQVKKSDVRRFYNQLIDDKVLKPSTVDVIHNIVHQVFQIAVDDDMIRSNPAANMLREIKMAHGSEIEKRKALTLEQEELFLGYLARTPKYQHWYPVFYIMANTGMRVGEITGLRWCDVDMENGIISVNHTLVYYNHRDEKGCYFSINTPKTKAGIMILPMQRKTHRFTKRLSKRCLITLRRNTMFSRMAGYQAFRTGIKATAIFLLGEKQTVSNGIKQDGSMAWMQHRPQMRIRPLFADTGILRMAIANTNTRGPSLEKMRTSLPIMVPELLP